MSDVIGGTSLFYWNLWRFLSRNWNFFISLLAYLSIPCVSERPKTKQQLLRSISLRIQLLAISPRCPRKLKITIFWRHVWYTICMTAPKIVVPDLKGENWFRQSVLKAQGNDWYQLHCPIRRPSRHRYGQKTIFLYTRYQTTTRSDENKWHYYYYYKVTGTSRSILRVSIWIFNLDLNRMYVQTNGKPAPSCYCTFSECCILSIVT